MDVKTRFFPTLSLIIVLLAACAPKPITQGPALIPTDLVNSSGSNAVGETPTVPALDIATATSDAVSGNPTALPIATSRGPNLEATDPSTVNLASGGLLFVEFFRFT